MNLFSSTKMDLVEAATSYRDFGVPSSLAKEWVQ